MTISAGDSVPNFQAKVTDGEDVDDFEFDDVTGDGPIVVGFFPFAFTGVCESQMADLRDNLDDLEAEGATVFGLTVSSPFALQGWSDQNGFGFDLIADWNREGIEAFGFEYDEMMGLERVTQRATAVVNSQGDVEWTWTTDDPGEKPNVEDIKNVLAKVD